MAYLLGRLALVNQLEVFIRRNVAHKAGLVLDLYSLAEAACLKYKLFDYLGEIRDLKNSALAMIDRNTLNNRMMENGTRLASSWDRAYYDGLAGDGLAIE